MAENIEKYGNNCRKIWATCYIDDLSVNKEKYGLPFHQGGEDSKERMTREEILQIAKPILFNTDMVTAILRSRKTATRRLPKIQQLSTIKWEFWQEEDVIHWVEGKYGKAGDYLYVRETWANLNTLTFPCYYYRASDELPEWALGSWRPSIHMPKEAARIFLRIKEVRAERLHTMTLDDFLSEGVVIREESFNDPDNAYLQAQEQYIGIWDATTTDPKDKYESNPLVGVIEFERVEVQE